MPSTTAPDSTSGAMHLGGRTNSASSSKTIHQASITPLWISKILCSTPTTPSASSTRPRICPPRSISSTSRPVHYGPLAARAVASTTSIAQAPTMAFPRSTSSISIVPTPISSCPAPRHRAVSSPRTGDSSCRSRTRRGLLAGALHRQRDPLQRPGPVQGGRPGRRDRLVWIPRCARGKKPRGI